MGKNHNRVFATFIVCVFWICILSKSRVAARRVPRTEEIANTIDDATDVGNINEDIEPERRSVGSCHCIKNNCGCCYTLNWHGLRSNGPLCANVTFHGLRTGATINLKFLDVTLFNTTIKGREPPPLCVSDVIITAGPIDICLKVYDLKLSTDRGHFCVEVSGKVSLIKPAPLDLGCFTFYDRDKLRQLFGKRIEKLKKQFSKGKGVFGGKLDLLKFRSKSEESLVRPRMGPDTSVIQSTTEVPLNKSSTRLNASIVSPRFGDAGWLRPLRPRIAPDTPLVEPENGQTSSNEIKGEVAERIIKLSRKKDSLEETEFSESSDELYYGDSSVHESSPEDGTEESDSGEMSSSGSETYEASYEDSEYSDSGSEESSNEQYIVHQKASVPARLTQRSAHPINPDTDEEDGIYRTVYHAKVPRDPYAGREPYDGFTEGPKMFLYIGKVRPNPLDVINENRPNTT